MPPSGISQSGETADTLAALREAKRAGCRVLSVVNVVGSTIATESDDVLYTWAGPEISVASTKAYSTQLAVIYLLALYIGEQLGKFTQEQLSAYIAALEKLPEQIDEMLKHKENIQFFASKYFNASDMYFIGRNVDYAASLEASLKLKEISYIHSEAYAAGELKHGPISLIEDGTLVIALATDARSSPARPISPNTTVSSRIGVSFRLDTSAIATARSTAGSSMRRPPTTFKYASKLEK